MKDPDGKHKGDERLRKQPASAPGLHKCTRDFIPVPTTHRESYELAFSTFFIYYCIVDILSRIIYLLSLIIFPEFLGAMDFTDLRTCFDVGFSFFNPDDSERLLRGMFHCSVSAKTEWA